MLILLCAFLHSNLYSGSVLTKCYEVAVFEAELDTAVLRDVGTQKVSTGIYS